ncbi:class I SAM-dependent methyltransferase [Nocardioides acrostichi]|uniref:Class I SAM-dependent methyltransferase n=1 Tax=Nocardioides acrostichi TaxID=2784339 RepID=A0A930Y5U6_9ACTN|nr:class I SAM-dependent methyltransferase [Nocardioides acrostichi]MBF4160251.1 class I SAM-dependent methyltransferase [Nocardioides acrostichi]
MPAFTHVLFPGRHHCVTRFQVDYLRALLAGECRDIDGEPLSAADDAGVVWAITSASHAHTRRNPIPGSRRQGLVERVCAVESLPGWVVAVPDVPAHPRFAELVVTSAATELAASLDPATTIVACSTLTVAAEYAALGYRIAAVEADPAWHGEESNARPWDVVEACARGDQTWRELAHPETVAYFDRYRLADDIAALFADPVVSDEGDLTTTRDYRTYATSFESASERKWGIVGGHLRPGRVVDIGCATGGLLEQAAQDPAFFESDLFGIDVARPLLAEAEHRKEAGVFANPNIWFLHANVLTTEVMAPRSVDSTVTVALTHEICSYGDGVADLETFARRIHAHTRPGGVWVNSDVLGPADPERVVRLRLRADDGENLDAPLDLDDAREATERVAALSTHARLVQFGHDFPRLSGAAFESRLLDVDRSSATWELPLRWAMEFMTRKDYTDNWLSECHERFCDLTYAGWRRLLTDAGFELDAASQPVRNDWLVEHRFDPVAELTDPDGHRLEWPETHVLTVARRPVGS